MTKPVKRIAINFGGGFVPGLIIDEAFGRSGTISTEQRRRKTEGGVTSPLAASSDTVEPRKADP